MRSVGRKPDVNFLLHTVEGALFDKSGAETQKKGTAGRLEGFASTTVFQRICKTAKIKKMLTNEGPQPMDPATPPPPEPWPAAFQRLCLPLCMHHPLYLQQWAWGGADRARSYTAASGFRGNEFIPRPL